MKWLKNLFIFTRNLHVALASICAHSHMYTVFLSSFRYKIDKLLKWTSGIFHKSETYLSKSWKNRIYWWCAQKRYLISGEKDKGRKRRKKRKKSHNPLFKCARAYIFTHDSFILLFSILLFTFSNKLRRGISR